MRTELLLFPVLLAASLSWAQAGHPIPAGLHQAEKAEDQFEKNSVPPLYQRPAPDLAKFRQDAQELATIAGSIPSDADQTSKGMLPKDLDQKLKRIEKLAKQLRAQISH